MLPYQASSAARIRGEPCQWLSKVHPLLLYKSVPWIEIVRPLVRLVNGGASYGRVEVYHNGQWGTVCDDAWDINDANVVCKQLGFPSASSAPPLAAYGQGSDPIWMEEVNCQGGEASLLDCAHTGWGIHNCGHSEDASVVCNT
ncbi:hypothetical protein ACROYT_G030159 [Oculina patagonica]